MTPETCMREAEATSVAAVLQRLGGPARIRLPMSADFLSSPIDDLALSVRARNALMRAGVDTVGRLTDRLRENAALTGIRNLGKKSAAEVRIVLTEAAYRRLTEPEKRAFWTFAALGP